MKTRTKTKGAASGRSPKSKKLSGESADKSGVAPQVASTKKNVTALLPLIVQFICNLSKWAAQNDESAIAGLYSIAERSTDSLNALSIGQRKQIAGFVTWWPVNLSNKKSWNDRYISEMVSGLKLGSSRRSIIDMEAIFKRGTRPKILAAQLVGFVENCRRLGMLRRRLHKLFPDLATNKTSLAELQSSAQWQADLQQAYNRVEEILKHIMDFLGIELPNENEIPAIEEKHRLIAHFSKLALQLPPILVNRASVLSWFDTGIKLLACLSSKKYQSPEYSLTEMGMAYAKSHGDISNPAFLRQGIRNTLLTAFDSVLKSVDRTGFVETD